MKIFAAIGVIVGIFVGQLITTYISSLSGSIPGSLSVTGLCASLFGVLFGFLGYCFSNGMFGSGRDNSATQINNLIEEIKNPEIYTLIHFFDKPNNFLKSLNGVTKDYKKQFDEGANFNVCHVNVIKHPKITSLFRIAKTPSFIIATAGQEIGRREDEFDVEILSDIFARNLELTTDFEMNEETNELADGITFDIGQLLDYKKEIEEDCTLEESDQSFSDKIFSTLKMSKQDLT